MSNIKIERYQNTMQNKWNSFISNSKNGTFLFNRNYMDYHEDRFFDASFIFHKNGEIVSVIPGVIKEYVYMSHPGLTYGGLILSYNITLLDVLLVFDLLNCELKKMNIKSCIYKPVPYIYHSYPSQEDLYVLYRLRAQLIGRNASSTIQLENHINFVESRKSGIRKSLKNNVSIKRSNDFVAFWEILNNNLLLKHGVAPVHSISEIKYLYEKFPLNIKLYGAFKEDIMIAGCVLFDMNSIIHVQYISSSELGKNMGALDLLFSELILNEYKNRNWFDFGHSNEQSGKLLNEKLIFQKEGFGGRAIVYDTYEYLII